MTKNEKTAFFFGQTFDCKSVPDGYSIACCFDRWMYDLIHETGTEKGNSRNQKIMKAWYEGIRSQGIEVREIEQERGKK